MVHPSSITRYYDSGFFSVAGRLPEYANDRGPLLFGHRRRWPSIESELGQRQQHVFEADAYHLAPAGMSARGRKFWEE